MVDLFLRTLVYVLRSTVVLCIIWGWLKDVLGYNGLLVQIRHP